ncbi:MAG: choice-of-anchor D domain-containing protein [Spirochaetes bacterium]|nr:choice-of-anchor D domain-containing protein [Spirochaetota bacterium]
MKNTIIIACMALVSFIVAIQSAAYSGTAVAAIDISPDGTVDFGSVPVNSKSDGQTFTITNKTNVAGSPGAVTILSISVGSGFVIKSTTCGTSLANPGDSCTADVVFAPSAESNYSESFTVQTDRGTWFATITGTGTTPESNTGNTGAALLLSALSKDDSDGCAANAATGGTGKKFFGPSALGLIALMGLVLGTAKVRRRMKRK